MYKLNRFLISIVIFFLISNLGGGSLAVLKATVDPSKIGIGARPLGMGKAFVGLADDCNAIFMNPAGISQVKRWQATTMYSRLINEVDYAMLGYVHSMSDEAIGIGYVGAYIGESVITSLESDIIVPLGDVIGYKSHVGLFSYGVKPYKYLKFDVLKNFSAGATLKVFSQELKGGTYEVGATGIDMDVGLMYTPLPWLYFGFSGQDVLPFDLGGRLRWTSGIEESIPAVAKLGVGAKVIGPDSPYKYYNHVVNVNYDMEMSIYQKKPGLQHVGLEWWPVEFAGIRVGLDQDAVAKEDGTIGVDNNLTGGVGIYYNDIEFNYAYHQFGDLSENVTHYFSLSFGVIREKPPVPVKKIEKYVRVKEPQDKLVTFDDRIKISGEILAPGEIGFIRGEDVEIKVENEDKDFKLEVPLKLGKNSLLVEVFSKTGHRLEVHKLRILRLQSFVDVREDYWIRDKISEVAILGLVKGYPDGTFRPEGTITRAELTALLVRAKVGEPPQPTSSIFVDLPLTHWAARYIIKGAALGIITGYPDKTFKPSKSINRVEGVSVIARFGEVKSPKLVVDKPFDDISVKHWAAGTITGAKWAGLLDYIKYEKMFYPKRDLTRGEAVEILSQTEYAKGLMSELLDFEKGYE